MKLEKDELHAEGPGNASWRNGRSWAGRLDRGLHWGRRQSVGGRLGRGPGILPEQGGLLLFPSRGFIQHLPHSELQPSLRNSKRLL